MMSKKNLLLLMAALLIFTLGCSLFSAIKGEPARPPDDIQRESLPREAVDADDAPQNGEPGYQALPANTESTGDDVVMYYEDFSDANSGWDRISWNDAMTDYTDYGSYNIQIYRDDFDAWANPGMYFSEDVIVGVTAKKYAGGVSDNYGVLCFYSGTPSEPSFYAFQLSSEGYAYISKSVYGAQDFVETAQVSPIQPGELVDFMASCKADGHLQFWLNDVPVIDTYDFDVLPGGDVGLIAGTFSENAYVDILFDDFYVAAPMQ